MSNNIASGTWFGSKLNSQNFTGSKMDINSVIVPPELNSYVYGWYYGILIRTNKKDRRSNGEPLI